MMTLTKLKTGLLALATVGSLGLATVIVPRSIGAAGQEPSNDQPVPAAKEEPRPAASGIPIGPIAPSPLDSTVLVRVKHEMGKAVGFAHGTITKSTSTETIILTCGHAFKSEPGSTAVEPTSIKVSYRMRLRDSDEGGLFSTTHSAEQSDAELIDCDSRRDVALVRIRPGEVLPVSPIVPKSWQPKPGLRMLTIQGDSGYDFAECSILGVSRPLWDNADYEAITCDLAPAQGTSGIGLFTRSPDGRTRFLAGVANYADPRTRTGLYASPKSIYSILDKNGLSSLYEAGAPKPAPEPDFPSTSPSAISEGTAKVDRLRAIERRVDAIDGKLDEILRLLRAK